MKKLGLYLVSFFSFCFALASEDTPVPAYNNVGRPLGTDIDSNPYSVEKQYAKADEIKKGNQFYDLKKATKVAMVGQTKDKFYSLVDIYQLAAKHNAEYQAARSTFAANVETVPTALGALLPQIDFQYNLRRDLYNQFGGQVDDTSNVINFQGSQVLFDWSKWKTYTQATYLQKSYAMIYAKAEQTLIVDTVQAYFELLRAEQALQFQFANEAWNKKLYLTQKYQYKSGMVSYADFKTTDAQYRQAIADRVNAQRNLINSKAVMAKLIGKRISSILYISKDTEFGNPVPDDIDYWLNTSQKYNLDIAQKKFEYQAATEGVGIEWGNFFPQVNLTGGINMQRNNLSGAPAQVDLIPTKYDVASIGGGVSWNLLRGGSDYAQLKKASYDNQAADYALLQTKREVYAGTVQAYQTVVLDAVRIKAYRESVYSGIASVKAILEGYEAGTQTIVDLLNRQAVLVQAQLSFADSIFNYVEDYVSLKQYQGGLTYKDVVYINGILGKTDIISEIATE
ncbi:MULTISPECIES: TolC family protein [unclassified Francisella]|uniref:TolC family protein n=1 Tax=unclassified Francisella TaxID=2610885 RepID=UPI002E32FC52|nr:MULTISPECIES: TolC family protein [unclassified Francisella]MED7818964.1 TolC family protein [Francisella sp. 19S2-4]MED7829801.1 TolC family protein [Francisella sp. 19S2-10]